MNTLDRHNTGAEGTRVFVAEGAVDAAPGLLRVGTRGSALAVAQTTTVAEIMAAATGLDVALVIVTTQGDTSRAPLSQLGGTGVFVSTLRDALLAGECDFAVHSLKDLPTGACPGIGIGAIPERADARDALCARDGLTLDALPSGARVGTGSPRRAAQLLARRPDLDVRDLRGNVDTRLGRVGVDLDAVVLACAGLDRLGRSESITERFPLDEAPAAPGQGALAIEVRADDATRSPYAEALAALDHAESRASALAERAVLATLEAGCGAPVGATAHVGEGRLVLRAEVASLDGTQRLVTVEELPWAAGDPEHAQTPQRLGRAVAQRLFEMGAAMIAPLSGTAPGADRPGGSRPDSSLPGAPR
ncbi:hydroxymethylbilane synthase [Leucobacter ruminantium]|uniref:Porphobilinogen deaminase n=1 Tax=Leucobacter ruminantium TaxID=1289170 RepID=A0A939LUL6_9MICO|nr:hydroxymethylbilane synthase [Leucobacter ruminantium]MBO1804686.1 hydroxymethylbilane synthase [Leucobacter ruminantium]